MGRRLGDVSGPGGSRTRLTLERPEPAAGGDGEEAVPVLHLEGELDIDTVPGIDRFLRRRLGPLYERRSLVIDLRGVTFVDSSFIAYVVRLAGEARRGRGELVLAHPTGRVRSHLCMVGLPNLVPVYESLEDALRALGEAGSPLIPPVFGLAS